MKEAIGPMVHHKKKQPNRILLEAMTRVLAYEIKAAGIDNLRQISKLIEQGKKIVIMPNHLSNADYSVIIQSLKSNGFPKIAGRIIPLEGLKLEKNPVTKFLAAAHDTIHIWPPTINPQSEEERRKKFAMDRESMEYAKRSLESGHYILIFAEGTRSRNGKMQKGQPGVAHFLTLTPETFILPIGIFGTEKILPPGSSVPIPSLANVVYGEPFGVSEAIALFSHLPKNEMRIEIIDYAMRRVASLVPPQYRGVYA